MSEGPTPGPWELHNAELSDGWNETPWVVLPGERHVVVGGEHRTSVDARLIAAAPALLAALEVIADAPCEASEFYEIAEDGVQRCLDPEFNDMSGNPTLTLCAPCRARAAIALARGEEGAG